jgi:ATP phosphoribosyltransferase
VSGESGIRLALPGKGALEAVTLAFLAEAGMKVNRSNPRQYLARMDNMPGLEVIFQRAADIPSLVQEGDAALGITGYDILAEHRGHLEHGDGAGDPWDAGSAGSIDEGEGDGLDDDLIILERGLGYGKCRLVIAVPETWIDVSTCADLWHLAGYYFTHKGRGLRIATKYPALTGQFLRRRGILHCKIVSPHGALEAAPLTDTADLIVDLTETGTTLRENHLKLLEDGVVLYSQACLVANTHLLKSNKAALRLASTMLELIEARMQARNRSILTAHLRIQDKEKIRPIHEQIKTRIAGAQLRPASIDAEGMAAAGGSSFTLSGVVNMGNSSAELLEIVALLRAMGASHIDITPLTYRFNAEARGVRTLRERLKRLP